MKYLIMLIIILISCFEKPQSAELDIITKKIQKLTLEKSDSLVNNQMLKLLEEGLSINSEDFYLKSVYLSILLRSKRFTQLDSVINKINIIDTSYISIYYFCGILKDATGQSKDALEIYSKTKELLKLRYGYLNNLDYYFILILLNNPKDYVLKLYDNKFDNTDPFYESNRKILNEFNKDKFLKSIIG